MVEKEIVEMNSVPQKARIRKGKIALLLTLLSVFYFDICIQNACAQPTSKDLEIDSLKTVLSKSLKPQDKIQSLFALGKTYYANSDMDKALAIDLQLLDYISLHGSKKDSAKVMRYIGLVYMQKSLYDKSLDYLMQAQRLYGESGDSSQLATTLMNVGIIHDYLNNLPMSLMYYNKAHDYFKRKNDETGMANCGINISIVLTKQKKYREACDYLLEVADIYKKSGNETYLAAAYSNLGIAYKKLNEYDKAIDFQNKAFAIYSKNKDTHKICIYHLNMGEILIDMKKVDEAGIHLKQAEVLAIQLKSPELKAWAYDFLSDYNLAKKNYFFAYDYLKKSKIINDSILNAETTKKVSEIQYKYEITKREADNEHLVKQNLDKELQLSKKNLFLYILSGVILLIALLVGFLLNQNRIKKRANAQLEEKNKLIERQKDELVLLNASKDKFLSILAHDIKNPLSTILGISELLNVDYEKLTEEEKRVFTNDIHTLATNLFEIINTLLSWAVSQGGLTAIHPKDFNIHQLSQKASRNLSGVAKQKNINLLVEGDENLLVFADDNMLLSVLHNLISNAIKFTHLGGEIKVKTIAGPQGYAEISVIDTGIGLSEKSQEKLFLYDQHFLCKGTAGESGTGLGLILCKDFVEKNGGKIWVESILKEGSTFKFTLPVA